jgi:hypothetical protein
MHDVQPCVDFFACCTYGMPGPPREERQALAAAQAKARLPDACASTFALALTQWLYADIFQNALLNSAPGLVLLPANTEIRRWKLKLVLHYVVI